jgi:hypothetical protein
MLRNLAALPLAALLLLGGPVSAQPTQPASAPRQPSVVVLRLEPLGLDAERAARLEVLFRLEIERLVGAPLLGPGRIERALSRDPELRGCSGETACLAAIGKKLGVDLVISGNIGELGESYVLNLKLIDVASASEVRRISEPVRGEPDELIEATRVAAYRLLAPERLRGAIAVLSDLAGAQVLLDDKPAGKTPLVKPIADLEVGTHTLRITAPGYSEFKSDVEVRFQKTTQVVVQMIAAAPAATLPGPNLVGVKRAPTPWYSSTWAYVAVGVAAVAVGAVIGYALAPDGVIDCGVEGCQ